MVLQEHTYTLGEKKMVSESEVQSCIRRNTHGVEKSVWSDESKICCCIVKKETPGERLKLHKPRLRFGPKNRAYVYVLYSAARP